MWIRRIEVKNCAGIAAAGVDLEPGLNILYGPNELGKSSLVKAIRAALLLQASSTAAEELVDWHVDAPPEVAITLEQEPGRIYRVRKVFGGQGSQSYLEFSRDGVSFDQEHRGRDVDGALQSILKWGVDAPGGRGRRKRGMPTSFISTALLGEQSDVVAILQTSLEDDPDGAGRERLTEALEAMAEDPRLKRIIASAQEEVDKAFTATGAKRRGQASLWTQVREQLNTAEEHHRSVSALMAESEGARARIEALNDALLDAQSAQSEAREKLLAAEEAERAWQQRETLRLAYDQAAEAVESARSTFARRDEKAEELAAVELELAELVTQESQDQKTLADAEAQLGTAREVVRELETGANEQQRRLREQEIENERLSLERERDALTPRHDLAKRLERLDEEIRSLDVDHEAREAALADARDLLRQAKEKTEQDELELEDLEFDRYVTRLMQARASAREADESLKRANGANERARELEAQASELRGTIEQSGPTDDEIEALRGLAAERRIAREKLAVGLSMALNLEARVEVEIGIDGDDPKSAGERTEIEATREIEIRIPDIGTIRVRGGTADLARAADAAESDWQAASIPIFRRTGCSSLDELIQRHKALTEQEAQLVEIERQVADARSKAEDLDELERDAAEIDRIAALAQEYLEEPIHEYVDSLDDAPDDESAIEASIVDLRAAMEERTKLCQDMEVKVATDERDLKALEATRSSKQADLESQSVDFEEGWQKYLEEAEAIREEIEEALAANTAELTSNRAEATTEVDAARTDLESRQSAFDQARENLQETRQELEAARAEQARLTGELAEREKAAEDTDLDAAEQAFGEAEASFSAIEDVDEPSPGNLEELRSELDEAERLVRQLDGEMRTAEGALQQVGGQYAKEQVEQAEERIEAIRDREHDLDVEFDAWKMLREVLTEAEREDSVHLGNALVQPVSDRMRELTAGRYGDIVIGPQLDSSGIEFAGGERSFERLSVGTQEQIALLLRLSIAEALGAFVVLDDQLTQSDEQRLGTMMAFLNQSAKAIQVVVLTCHVASYAAGGESANIINLSNHMMRTLAPEDDGKPSGTPSPLDESNSANDGGADGHQRQRDNDRPGSPRKRRRRRQGKPDAKDEISAALRASLEKATKDD